MQCHCYHCSVVVMEAVAHICIQSKKTNQNENSNHYKRRKETKIYGRERTKIEVIDREDNLNFRTE